MDCPSCIQTSHVNCAKPKSKSKIENEITCGKIEP
jgi:hypothetical protein